MCSTFDCSIRAMTVLLEYLNLLPNILACDFASYLYADINFMACIIVGAYRYRVIYAWVDDYSLVQPKPD